MRLKLEKDLTSLKSAKLAQIDADALRELQRYRSSSDFALAVYARKRDELSAFDAGETSAERLAVMHAEAEATGRSISELAEVWRQMIRAEDQAVPMIEARRQVLRQAIHEAVTEPQIERIMAEATWN